MERRKLILFACCLALLCVVVGCQSFMSRHYGLPQQWEADSGHRE